MAQILLNTLRDSLPVLAIITAIWAFVRLTIFVGTYEEPYYKVNIGAHRKRLSALE